MLKTAVDRGEEILSNPPSRTEDSLLEYISNLKTARRELIGEKNDPRNVMGNNSLKSQTKIASVLGDVENNILNAELLLEAVRNEIPQEEMVETDNTGEMDVQASVEKLAVAAAVSTMGENRFERMSKGLNAFTQEIEPQLDPFLRDFPRQQYTARLEELIAMDNTKLAEEYKKTFPTKEWIGPDPEPVGGEGDLGYIPSHFEKDETTKPADTDTDKEFNNAIEKERKFRGIDQAEGVAGDKLDKAKKSSSRESALDSLRRMGIPEDEIMRIVAEIRGEVDFSGGPNEDPDFHENRESFSNTVTNDAGEMRYAKQADAVNSTPGSHEPASSSDGGAQLQAKPPEPEKAFEEVIEEEANKSTSAPRGPNRRIQKDVPAYSTPKDKLTAAIKLAEQYENMDAETALQIVNTVFADADSEEEAEEKADEKSTGSGEESSENDQVENNDTDLDGLFDD